MLSVLHIVNVFNECTTTASGFIDPDRIYYAYKIFGLSLAVVNNLNRYLDEKNYSHLTRGDQLQSKFEIFVFPSETLK